MKVHSRHNRLIESLFDILSRCMKVVYMLDVHPVADHKSLEAPLTAKNVCHQPLIRMTRYTVKLIMGSHKRKRTGLDTHLERREEDFPDSALGQICRSTVRTVYRLASAHKVLDAGKDVVRVHVTLISLHRFRSHHGNKIRILSEGLAAAAPTGIACHLDVRVECPVHVHCPHLGSSLASDLIRHLCVERRSKADACRISCIVRAVAVAVDRIDTEHDRNLESALHSQSLKIIRLLDSKDMEERSDQTFLCPLLY